VDVESESRGGPQCPDDRGSDRQVRNEVTVHDVDVDEVGAAAFRQGERIGEPREVRREERRSDSYVAHDAGGIAEADCETVSETTSRRDSG